MFYNINTKNMKVKIAVTRLIISSMAMIIFTSCQNLITCREINKYDMTILLDISDELLFDEINHDLVSNFQTFMAQTKFANIQECQEVKMNLGYLSGKDELNLRSVSIGINQKGLSGREKRNRSNPIPVVNLIKRTLKDYSDMSMDEEYNSSTNIVQTTLKTIVGMETDVENTLLIFSDMVINNKTENVNFYRFIPTNAGESIRKLIDITLLGELQKKLEEGLEVKVIIILKNEVGKKVKKKNVKDFWNDFFKILQLDDIQFIDNCSNHIKWN
jgi:hypothetical protein